MTIPCPARATVYCYECGHNRQVMRIAEQRTYRHRPYQPPVNGLRSIRGKAVCGHVFNVVSTPDNLAVMREWLTAAGDGGKR